MRRNLSFPGISRCYATGTGAGPGAWARTMSALGGCAGLPNPPVRRAVASFMSTLRSVTAAARRSQTPCARYWASNSPTGPPPNGLSTPSPSTLSPRTCTPPARPDPDLVIRTSEEQRLSGFLLWQSAYSKDVVHRGVLARVPPGRLSPCAARLRLAAPPLRHVVHPTVAARSIGATAPSVYGEARRV